MGVSSRGADTACGMEWWKPMVMRAAGHAAAGGSPPAPALDAPEQRSFGLSVGMVCALVAAYSLWRGRHLTMWISGMLALGLLVPACVKPSLLRLPHRWWWRLARALAWVNTRVLLSALFFLIVTPAGVLGRMGGWDPLRHRRGPHESGWVPYPERLRDPRHYERLY